MHKKAYILLLLCIYPLMLIGSSTIRSSHSSSRSSSSSSSRDDDRSCSYDDDRRSSARSSSYASRQEESRSTTVDEVREERRSASCSSARSSTSDDDYEERRERDYEDRKAEEEKKRIEDDEWNARDWEERSRARATITPVVPAQPLVAAIVPVIAHAPVTQTQETIESRVPTTQHVEPTMKVESVVSSIAQQNVVTDKQLTDDEMEDDYLFRKEAWFKKDLKDLGEFPPFIEQNLPFGIEGHPAVISARFVDYFQQVVRARRHLDYNCALKTAVGRTEKRVKSYWQTPERLKFAHLVHQKLADEKVQSDEIANEAILQCKVLEQMPTFTVREMKSEQDLFYRDRFDKILQSLQFKRLLYEDKDANKITVFIPTKAFYQKNKELFSVPRICCGYPVLIPEKFKKPDSPVLLRSGNNPQPHLSSGGGGGGYPNPPFNPKDPKDPKEKEGNNFIANALLTTAYMAGVAMVGSAEYAGVAGVAVVSGSAVPVLVGGVVIGYCITALIPGMREPVVLMQDVDTRHMTSSEREEYRKAKAQYDEMSRRLYQSQQAVAANEAAFQNGRYVKSTLEGDPIIDGRPVDPILHYHYGNGQRLLDLSVGVFGSTDRFAVQDDKVIKFTLHLDGEYTATVVDEVETLSRKDKAVLRDYWNYDIKQKIKEKERRLREQEKSKKGGGPDKDPDKNNKNAKRGLLGYVGEKAKKKLDEREAARAAKIAKDAPKLNSKGKPMKWAGNPKHHENSRGNVSKPPQDGHKVLQESHLVKVDEQTGLETRVAIEDGKIVKIFEHTPGEYHGFVLGKDAQVDRDVDKVLKALGLVNKRGNVK